MSTQSSGNGAPQNGSSGSRISSISDLSYRNYDGPLQSRAIRWWVIALSTIKSNVNKSRFGYWIPFGVVFLWFLGRCIFFYFVQGVQSQMQSVGMNTGTLPPNPYTAELYASMASIPMSVLFINLPLFVAALIVGSSSIAADNRANALLVYLSKPLTRVDYLVGKWVGVFILLAAMILIPSLMEYSFFVAAYTSDGFLKDNPTLILRLIAACLIPAALHTSLIVGISAWSKSGRIAGVIYAAFYLILGILSGTIGTLLWATDTPGTYIVRSSIILHSSVDGVRNGLAQHLYGVGPVEIMKPHDSGNEGERERKPSSRGRRRLRRQFEGPEKWPETPPLWALLLIGGGMIVIPIGAAAMKVRAVEIING